MTHPRNTDIHDYIHELTNKHTHTEHLTERHKGRTHTKTRITTHPPLITQLNQSDTPNNTNSGDGPRPGFASKPAARLDALDTLLRIDHQARQQLTNLGHTPPRSTTATIRKLGSLHPNLNPPTQKELETTIRSWYTQARIITGWDTPPWNPDNTCPQCAERGTLKIRLADHIAMCTNDPCRATWTPDTIGLLADHIRAEASVERTHHTPAGPCWCPYPEPTIPNLQTLCPRCGSSRCWHAVMTRLALQLTNPDTPGDQASA